MMTDPISDMLTRLRNGLHAKQDVVEIPSSKLKLAVLKLLEQEGYIRTFTTVEDKKQGKILVTLRYTSERDPVITEMKRISRPGRRVYVSYREIKPVLGGLGLTVLSTSRGLMTDKEAREAKVGGEILCTVW